MTARLNAASASGGFLVAFGLLAGYFAWQIPAEADGDIGARIFPLIASSAITVLGLLEFRQGLDKTARSASDFRPMASIAGLLLLCIGYAWLIPRIGYLLATGVAAPLAMWVFGMRNPLALLATALLCPAIYHLLFFELLGVFPPYGEWIDLLDLIEGT